MITPLSDKMFYLRTLLVSLVLLLVLGCSGGPSEADRISLIEGFLGNLLTQPYACLPTMDCYWENEEFLVDGYTTEFDACLSSLFVEYVGDFDETQKGSPVYEALHTYVVNWLWFNTKLTPLEIEVTTDYSTHNFIYNKYKVRARFIHGTLDEYLEIKGVVRISKGSAKIDYFDVRGFPFTYGN